MWCYIYFLGLVLLPVGALILLCSTARLHVRWWALPVIVATLILSFPGVFADMFWQSLAPALWLTFWVSDWSRWLVLSWVVGLAAVLVLRGLVFPSGRVKAAYLTVVIGAMTLATPLNCYHAWLAPRGDHWIFEDVLAQAASPDGSQRGYAVLFAWTDIDVTLWTETNRWFGVKRESFGTVDFEEPVWPEGGGPWRVVWSKDSKAVSCWYGQLALVTHDFATGRSIELTPLREARDGLSREESQREEQALFAQRVRDLIDHHGGPAVPPEARTAPDAALDKGPRAPTARP